MLERELVPGVRVTELGLGCAGLGNLYKAVSPEQAAATVDRAWELGIRYFDTAPHYGLGLSERRLGEALAARPRKDYLLSTKVGRLLVDRVPPAPRDDDIFEVPGDLRRVWDFSESGIRRSLEESLGRLGTDHVDILFLHDPDLSGDPDAIERGAAALCRLRDEGMVRVVGIGSNDSAAITRAFASTDIDTAMVAGRYTLLRDDGMHELLEAAGDRRVILAGVFNSGLLATPSPSPDAKFDYGPVPPEVLARARALADAASQHGTTLPALAIAHALRLPQTASVVLGMSSPATVEQNVERYEDGRRFHAWSDLPSVDAAQGRADQTAR